jgi:hypothetical protein
MVKTMDREEPMSTTSGEEPIATNPAVFAAILQQNWENVRHIKSERMWYLNTHAVTSAGVLSFLQSVRGGFVLQLSLLLCMCFLSAIGLLTSLRLKAELEECLEKIQAMVALAQVDRFMALGRLEGRRSHYPAFRWIFPVVYSLSTVLFCALFVYQVALGRHP